MNNNEKKIVTVAVTNEEQNAFVGLRIRDKDIIFCYPESYDIASTNDKQQFRNDVLNIIQTISLAKTKSSPNNQVDNGMASSNQFSLLSFLWIIKDYLSHGYYKNSEKVYKTNANGKINWKKTLNTQPIISNDNIIYANPVFEVRNECDDIITLAHKLCVFDSVRKIGWLFGMNEKSVYVPHVTNSMVKQYIKAIKTELKRTFDDVKKLRLNHMLKVLLGVDDSDRTKEIVYGVDKYHYVFERMVDHIFSNVDDITKYNPNAKWHIRKQSAEGYDDFNASSLRPDTVRLEKSKSQILQKNAFIIDAKLYRYGHSIETVNANFLPATTSIQKQITYGDNIICNLRKVENIDKVFNAFILPYNKNNNPFGFSSDLEYIGYSEANWRNDNLSHEKVYAFLIDMKHLVASWTYGNCMEDIKTLKEGIEKEIENN